MLSLSATWTLIVIRTMSREKLVWWGEWNAGSQPQEFPMGDIQNWPLHAESKERRRKGTGHSRWKRAVFVSKGASIRGSCAKMRFLYPPCRIVVYRT